MNHKTRITFRDEEDNVTELTLDKWVADELFVLVGDLHSWVQLTYDKAVSGQLALARRVIAQRKRTGKLHRRAIGDLIRLHALSMVAENIDF